MDMNTYRGPKVFLETSRLRLRNIKADDLDIIYDYRNNERCSKYQRDQTKTKDGLVALIDKHKEDRISVNQSYIIAIELKSISEMIGEIVVMPTEDTISLGYTVSYRYHRKGYAYEALSSLIDVLHKTYPNHEFVCFTDKDNMASKNILFKLGYDYLGYCESTTSDVFGKWMKGNPFDEKK